MVSSFLQSIGIGLAALIAYNLALIIYRLYLHPLARFPGPKVAAVTQWYEIYFDLVKGGMFIWELERMHEQYGPIIRINPDELHVKDAAYYETIYSSASSKRDKYDKWWMMAGAPRSAFSTTAHDLHRTRRAALNPFFAKRSVVRLEPRISSKVTELCGRLAQCKEEGTVVYLNTAFMALTMDVISEYCYGKSAKFLEKEDFNQGWHDAMGDLFEKAAFRRHVPWLVILLQKLPVQYVLKLMPAMEFLITWQKDIRIQVSETLSKRGKKEGEEIDSIFEALRDSEALSEEEKSMERLAEEGEVLIGAGSETTAKTLAYTSFYILETPSVLKRLRNELKTVMKRSTDLPTWAALERLPYLTAVVLEGLRLTFGVSTRLPRVAHEALQYGEWTIPPRTPISETTYFISTDSDIFPDPHAFNPERWMQKDGPRLDKYLTNFCKGTRACLGINLAYAELFLTLAGVFRRFDFELYETTIDDVKMVRDAFVPAPRLGSKGVRVLVKDEVE